VRDLAKVAGRCPSCGSTNLLFVGVGGHVTCSLDSCPNPSAAADLLAGTTRIVRSVVSLADGPTRERVDFVESDDAAVLAVRQIAMSAGNWDDVRVDRALVTRWTPDPDAGSYIDRARAEVDAERAEAALRERVAKRIHAASPYRSDVWSELSEPQRALFRAEAVAAIDETRSAA
jgi:hypothetical protein